MHDDDAVTAVHSHISSEENYFSTTFISRHHGSTTSPEEDDDGDAADADAPSTDKLNGRNARIIQLIKVETIFISINSSSSASR